MKRDERLYPLSHDHHGGLIFSLRLKKGARLKADLKEISGYINYFWENEMERHFEDEESFLLPLLDDENDHKQRTLREHMLIRNTITEINGEPGHEKVMQLSDLVNDHIRFEERILFPYLEETLTDDQLNILGEQLDNHPPFCDNWTRAFWRA